MDVIAEQHLLSCRGRNVPYYHLYYQAASRNVKSRRRHSLDHIKRRRESRAATNDTQHSALQKIHEAPYGGVRLFFWSRSQKHRVKRNITYNQLLLLLYQPSENDTIHDRPTIVPRKHAKETMAIRQEQTQKQPVYQGVFAFHEPFIIICSRSSAVHCVKH